MLRGAKKYMVIRNVEIGFRKAIEHFSKELLEFAKLSGPTADVACDKCPEELDIHHMALNHGWIKKLLNGLTPEELEVKRNEVKKPKDPRNVVKKRRSSIDLTKHQSKKSKTSFK